MFDPNASLTEKARQDEFLKMKINEAFKIFFVKEKGYLDKREVPYIMRYLGQFPSEAQVRDAILPEIEEDDPSEYIKYNKFEPYMLKVLKDREFEPDDAETLLAAFKLLDPEGKGYIEIDTMNDFLEKHGIEFRKLESESFNKFATNGKDKESQQVIYYEDYISRLNNYVEKHLENVMKGYSSYVQNKK